MKTKQFLILFLIIINISNSWADNYPTGASSRAMANSTVAVANIWSTFHNQAGLEYLDGITFGTHLENWFGLEENGVKSVAFAIPTNSGTFALDYTYYGFSSYNEMKTGLAYAKKLSEVISVGIQLDYFNFHQQIGYGNIGVAVAEIGILTEPIKKMKIGLHIFNPWRASINAIEKEKMPTIFRLGMAYSFSEKVLFTLETEKYMEITKPTFKSGIEYNIVSNLYLRGGISTNPITNSFGIGYKVKGVGVDIGFYNHQFFGYNASVSMYYTFGNKN